MKSPCLVSFGVFSDVLVLEQSLNCILQGVHECLVGIRDLAFDVGQFDDVLVLYFQSRKELAAEHAQIFEAVVRLNFWKDFEVSIEEGSNELKLILDPEAFHESSFLLRGES
jgi:hypothetical protein